MTILETPTTQRLRPVAFDLYRDVHKAIRAELFAVVGDAGRLDPSDDCGVAALADEVRTMVQFLVEHAQHEDGSIQPALELHAPNIAAQVADDHHILEARMDLLVEVADAARTTDARRPLVHELYIELAAFTGTYLLHQDFEERQVGQAIESAVGIDGVLAIHGAIIGNMPPQQLVAGLALMLPAMNVDDRTDLLGGMRATAPAEAFNGVWSLAKSVLTPNDSHAVAVRLGLA